MRLKGGIGVFLISISILISFSNLTLIGAVIGAEASSSLSLVAVAFFVVGVVLLAVREGNLALKIMEGGALVANPEKLKKIARKMGYEGREVKEGYQILDEQDKPLTVIPRHHISKGVSRRVLKSLATGESSFRYGQGYLRT